MIDDWEDEEGDGYAEEFMYDGYADEEEQNAAQAEEADGMELMQGFQNQVMWANSDDPRPIELKPGICFASLFSDYYGGRQPYGRFTHTIWRVKTDALSIVDADRFLNDLMERIPENWKKGFVIRDITPEWEHAGRAFFKVGQYWKEMILDGGKLTSNQMYCLLALFRMAQENSDIVTELYRLVDNVGLSWDKAFWVASQLSQHSGHLLVSQCDGAELLNREKGPELLDKWRLAHGFEKIDKMKREVFTKHRKKDESLNKLFGVTGAGGWNSIRVAENFSKVSSIRVTEMSQYVMTQLKIVFVKKKTRAKHAHAV